MRSDDLPLVYDPWLDLANSWPHVHVTIEVMRGDLLGELRDGHVIALRAGTTAAQRRCTLAHEIVHLERGFDDCGPWARREELLVHRTAAERLIPLTTLADAVRTVGGWSDGRALAHMLDVDHETLSVRLGNLSALDRLALRRLRVQHADLWSVA